MIAILSLVENMRTTGKICQKPLYSACVNVWLLLLENHWPTFFWKLCNSNRQRWTLHSHVKHFLHPVLRRWALIRNEKSLFSTRWHHCTARLSKVMLRHLTPRRFLSCFGDICGPHDSWTCPLTTFICELPQTTSLQQQTFAPWPI